MLKLLVPQDHDPAGREITVLRPANRDGCDNGPTWMFIQVPEAKSAKNRMHIDLFGSDREAEVQRLVGLGATHVADKDEWGVAWTVLQDPSGNEFCVAGAH